jgi:hypothetical protein
MTKSRFAQLLIEGPDTRNLLLTLAQGHKQSPEEPEQEPEKDSGRVDKKIAVFLNRLLLRIFSVPSLMSYLNDVTMFRTGDNDRCKIQLVFNRLPDEIHPQMKRLFCAPRDPKLFRFVSGGQARTGVELEVDPEDFGGEDFDYAV